MNSANAQVCLEVSFENHRKKKHLQPKKKKETSALLTRFCFFLFVCYIVRAMQSQQYTMLYQRRVDFCGGKVQSEM